MIKNTKNLLLASACLISTVGVAGPVQAQDTLQNATRAAIHEHPSVEAAQEALNITKAQKWEQYSGYFPQLSITGQAGRMYGDNSTSRGLTVDRGAAYSYVGEGSVTLSQMIFDGLETPNRVEAAQERKESAKANIFDVREALALRVAQSYLSVLRARQGLAMIQEHTAKVDNYLSRIRSMVDEGASDESELQQARDISVILKGIEADYQGQVMAAESQFFEATGYMPDAQMVEPLAPASLVPDDVVAAVNFAVEQHPSIRAAVLNANAADAEIDAEKGTLYPDLNGELSYLKSDKKDVIGGELIDARAVVRMNWNFSTGGAQLARIDRTKHAHKEALARKRETQRQVERDVRLAYSELSTSQQQLDLLKQRSELNEKLFAAYEAQFEGARVNLLQLMQAHNQLFNTQLEGVNGRYRYLAAQFAVLASMGRLQEVMNVDVPVATAQEEGAQGG